MTGIQEGTETRILDFDGKISKEVYIVKELDNRKKQYKLFLRGSNKSIGWVTQRRVLPIAIDGKAVVIESADKYKVVCPTCTIVDTINNVDNFTCQQCNDVFDLHWLTAKPITEITKKAQSMNENENVVDDNVGQEPQNPQSEELQSAHEESPSCSQGSAAAEPVAAEPVAAEPVAAEPQKSSGKVAVNIDSLKLLGELYTRKQLRFNHPGMDVKAHVLLIVDDNPRKLCFNTYNGTLGKKGNDLPTEAFQKNEMPEGKKLWFHVKNVDKQRQKLVKDGYERA